MSLVAETCQPRSVQQPMKGHIASVYLTKDLELPPFIQLILLLFLTVTLGSTIIFQPELTDMNKYGVLVVHKYLQHHLAPA